MSRKLDTAIAELLGIDINHAGEYSTYIRENWKEWQDD